MFINGQWVDYAPGGAGMNNNSGGGAPPVNPATGYGSYQGGSEYQKYLASGGKASEQEYINYNYGGGGGGGGAPASGGGGGLIQGRPGGTQGPIGGGAPGMPKYSAGQALGGAALAGAGAGAASIALGGLGSAAPLMAFGPAGIAAGAGLLALGAIAGKKSNKQFEGVIDTGGSEAWKQQGGGMAKISDGYIPTAEEFTQHGRWLMGQDTYAHDYGRTLGASDAQYYSNFQRTAQSQLDAGDLEGYRGTMASHGFETPGAPAAAPSGPSRRKAPAAKAAAPADDGGNDRDSVSKPASGLEDTIKTRPETVERPGLKPGVNKFLVPDRKRRAGFFSFAGKNTRRKNT